MTESMSMYVYKIKEFSELTSICNCDDNLITTRFASSWVGIKYNPKRFRPFTSSCIIQNSYTNFL